jgi:hypothetical protein
LKVPDFFEVHQEVAGLANLKLRWVVQNIVVQRNLPPDAGEGYSYAPGIHETPISLSLRGLTIREALEKLVAASEHNIWTLGTCGDAIDARVAKLEAMPTDLQCCAPQKSLHFAKLKSTLEINDI